MAGQDIKLRLKTSATGLNVMDDAGRKIKKVGNESVKTKQKMSLMTAGVGKLAGSIAALAGGAMAIKKISSAFGNFLDDADKVQKLSIRLGESTEYLSEMQFAADRAGISTTSLFSSIERMNKRLGEAKLGFGAAIPALKEMGIYQEVLNGKYKTAEDILPVLADHFAGLADDQKIAALAAQLFGREGVALTQLLKGGAAEIENMRDKARELGITINQDMADKAAIAKDKMANLNAVLTGTRNMIAVELAPAVSSFMDNWTVGFQDLIAKAKEFLGVQQKISVGPDWTPAADWSWPPTDGSTSLTIPKKNKAKTSTIIPEKNPAAVPAVNKYIEEARLIESTAKDLNIKLIELNVGEHAAKMARLEEWYATTKDVYDLMKEDTAQLTEYKNLMGEKYLAEEKERTTALETELVQISDSFQGIVSNFTSSFSQLGANIATGTSSIKAAFASMGESIISNLAGIITEMLAMYMLEKAISGIAGAAGINIEGAGWFTKMFPKGHMGGTVTQTGIQRYHNGGIAGLKSNEVPIIAEVGEQITPKKDVGKGGGPIVNIINKGEPLKEQSRQSRWENGQWLCDIVLEQLNGHSGTRNNFKEVLR